MAYDYSQYGGVLVERRDKVLTITLNAPETLNAFTGPMHTSMSRILGRCERRSRRACCRPDWGGSSVFGRWERDRHAEED